MENKKLSLFALLTAALVITSAPAISANIPAIETTFPTIHREWINLFTTIPALFIIIGIFCSITIERWFGVKRTILVSLFLVAFFGTIPVWYNGSFYVLFLSRCVLGLGIGLFNRLIIQTISSLTRGDTKLKARYLGLESAFEGLGGILMTLSVGRLVKISWQLSFLVYALAIVGFFGILIYFKEPTTLDELQVVTRLTKVPKDLKRKMIGLTILLFMIVSLFIVFNLQVTALLIEKRIGQATQGSDLIACISVGAFLAGNLFGKTYHMIHAKVLPLATLVSGLTLIWISQTSSLLLVMILSGVLGFSFRHIIPFFNHLFTSKGDAETRYGTILIIMAYNLGTTASPFIVKLLSMLHIEKASMILMISGGCFLAIDLASYCLNLNCYWIGLRSIDRHLIPR